MLIVGEKLQGEGIPHGNGNKRHYKKTSCKTGRFKLC